MKTSLLGGIALAIVGCGTVGHWGSSDGSGSAQPIPMPSPGSRGFPGASTPSFGPTTVASASPPPISGGTLAVYGKTVIVADPDRDQVYLVDLATRGVTATLGLKAGDEPGRVVVDTHGRAHVALRGGGAIMTIDLASAKFLSRRAVCPAPRGLAYDATAGLIHVACASGELVSLPAEGGDATRRLSLDLDLRDVVVEGAELAVTRFRSAEVLTIAADGTVRERKSPPDIVAPYMVPRIAWRMIARSGGDGRIVVHQRASGAIDNKTPASSQGGGDGSGGGGYTSAAGGCTAFASGKDAVAAGLTDFGPKLRSLVIPGFVLPVDVAMSPRGERLVVVSAGNGHADGGSSLFSIDVAQIPNGTDGCASESTMRMVNGQLTSVGFADDDTVLAFKREPATLLVIPVDASTNVTEIALSSISREDTGHAVFHSNTGAGIACASCHAEGGDDGLVWTFTAQGRRRTPSLKGTLQGTAPYHWSGEISDTPALVHKVYEEGMGGPSLAGDQVGALRDWLFAMPRPATLASVDAAAADRGRVLFEGAAGCATCHSGALLTNNATVDVGTGGAFQVPSLVGVAHRAPYLHNGCAATLQDRFGACGGGAAHGKAGDLAPAELADLIAHLQTL